MGFGAVITSGDAGALLPEELMAWLVEVRVEMELSRPTRYALRFEDDICDGQPTVEGAPHLAQGRRLGSYVVADDAIDCLVYGPVTEVRASTTLGGSGSWVEIRGEDRRVEMGRVGVQATYTGRASAVAAGILSAYDFVPASQDTLIVHDGQRNQLTQRGTDLAFLEDVARRNNMELWLSYEPHRTAGADAITVTETANLRTSPRRAQPGDVPAIPTLRPEPRHVLPVHPPRRQIPGVTRFEARVDYEKPTSASGFTTDERGDAGVVAQIVAAAQPVDPGRPVEVDGMQRTAIAPPQVTAEEAFLAQDALVTEQSWFVEVDGSTTRALAGFVLRPHQIVEVTHAGDRLSGAYQVMTVTHVVTATDHYMDFTLRANGLGGARS